MCEQTEHHCGAGAIIYYYTSTRQDSGFESFFLFFSSFLFFSMLGIRDAFHPNSVLQLIPVGVGEVKIQGVESGLYLAMNSKGQLYAEDDETNDGTIFLESSNGYYLNYLSQKYAHMGWYVGLTKEGRAKNGRKTWYPWGQKAIQFVPRRAYDDPHPLRYVIVT